MANPDVGDLHVNSLLTNMSIGYINADYIADRGCPLLPVNKQSDIIPEYDKSYWFRDDARLRAPGGDLHIGEYKVTTTATYFARNFQWATKVTPEQIANADAPFRPEQDATRLVTDKLQLKREVQFASNFMATSKWGTDDDNSATDWDDFANSNPIDDAETAARTVRQAIGRRPNRAVMGDIVWSALKQHPLILDRISGGATPGSPATITRQLVAALFELDELLVASAIQTATDEGVAEASATYTDVIDDDCLFVYVSPTPGIFVPSGMYTFYWRPLTGGGPQFIRRIEDTKVNATIIDGQGYWDQKLTCSKAGYFFSDIV